MKKTIGIFLGAIMLISLVACETKETDNASSNVSNNSGNINNSNSQDKNYTPNQEGNFVMLGSEGSNSHCSTNEGYYYLTESGQIKGDLYGRHLMYMDYATHQEIYLCSNSSCQHDTENCMAVFSDVGIDSCIFVWQNALYLLDRDYDVDGASGTMMSVGDSNTVESKSVVLYRMGLDGSNRTKVYTFEANLTVENSFFGDGYNLYFVTKKIGYKQSSGISYAASSERKLICVDPANEQSKTVCSMDFGDELNWDIKGCSGSYIVLSAIKYPDQVTNENRITMSDNDYLEMLSKCSQIYSVMDLNTCNVSEVYNIDNVRDNTSSCLVRDGYLFISEYISGNILKINLQTKGKSILASLQGIYYLLYAFDDTICCPSSDEQKDNTLNFVDITTG